MQAGRWVTLGAVVIALICTAGWFRAQQQLHEIKRSQIRETLEPIVELLKENAALTSELGGAAYADGDSESLVAYLAKARRDGIAKHADMKRLIDRLVNNNTAILTLLARYSTHAMTPAFRASCERFREYAVTMRERWQSVPEVFMAGGSLALSAPPFPLQFPSALAAELTAAGA
jgi:hypothetical protein